MPIQLDLMPLEEKLPDSPPPKTMVVRYGYLKEIGEFPSEIPNKVGCGTKLVIRSERGTELGEMLTTTCGNGGCNKSITRDKLLDYIQHSGARNYPFSEAGRILRVATAQDLAEQAKLDEHRQKHITLARELVERHQLIMKVVEVEHLLGGERIMFYFISEQRIDFRSLVRDLAHELHTRIEMRQVGARDEARLTADYEKCGQHCCCKQFLKVLTPISMRSAKIQKATLDPTKISGRCGRLMCCLRYEDQTYEELRKKLPKRNTRVKTEKGDAWVIDGQILTQLVLVQFDDASREAFPMEKILEFDRPKPVMADGRTMQSPNDRPPPNFDSDPRSRPPRGVPNGPLNTPPRERPRPGAPAQAPSGDPRALDGPTGGDLSNEPLPPADELDDLLADALDGQLPPPPLPKPLPPRPVSQPPQPRQDRVPNNPPPRYPRPQQKGGTFQPAPRVKNPPGPRPPQGFRPPNPQRPPNTPNQIPNQPLTTGTPAPDPAPPLPAPPTPQSTSSAPPAPTSASQEPPAPTSQSNPPPPA